MNRSILPILVLSCLNAFSAVVYVDRDNVSGIEDGLSWPTAFVEIQDGVDASVAGDEVWVAEGTYDEARSSLIGVPAVDTGSLVLKESVLLYGGFLGDESAINERDLKIRNTIIKGTTTADNSHSYSVVYGAADSGLNGFRVLAQSDVTTELTIVGIDFDSDNMTITNCEFEGEAYHTTIGVSASGQFKISDSEFSNHSSVGVSGWSGSTVERCVFTKNLRRALTIGSNSIVRDCIFVGNESNASGGGGAIRGGGNLVIERCIFENNIGGALSLGGGPITINNSVFWNNSGGFAGGVYAFGGNDFDNLSGTPPTELFILNSTFVGNTGGVGAIASLGGGAATRAINCIFSNNSVPEFGAEPGSHGFLATHFSLINSEPVVSPTFLEHFDTVVGAPMFLDRKNGDFRITGGSAAVDSGTMEETISGTLSPTDDIIGTPRPLGVGYDIGAYEFDPDNPPTLPDGSGDSTCFVATAAYGTPLAGEIDVLRGGRDEWLLSNPLGSAFTDTYYRLSPPVADFVARNPLARTVVRAGLEGMIFFLQMSSMLWVAVGLAGVGIGVFGRRV